MKPITAAQARDMNPKNAADAHLVKIFAMIETAAKAGKFQIRMPHDLTEIAGEGSVRPNGIGMEVTQQLRQLGYQINDHWEARQFVDAYLTIEWGTDDNE